MYLNFSLCISCFVLFLWNNVWTMSVNVLHCLRQTFSLTVASIAAVPVALPHPGSTSAPLTRNKGKEQVVQKIDKICSLHPTNWPDWQPYIRSLENWRQKICGENILIWGQHEGIPHNQIWLFLEINFKLPPECVKSENQTFRNLRSNIKFSFSFNGHQVDHSKTKFSSQPGALLLMGGPLYSEGTGLLLAGAAVFVVGFFVFCCIDHCWLKRDLRKADRWSIFPSSNSNSASESTYSPWYLTEINWAGEECTMVWVEGGEKKKLTGKQSITWLHKTF